MKGIDEYIDNDINEIIKAYLKLNKRPIEVFSRFD